MSSGTVSDLEMEDVALTALEAAEGRALRRFLVLKELWLSPSSSRCGCVLTLLRWFLPSEPRRHGGSAMDAFKTDQISDSLFTLQKRGFVFIRA